MNSIESEPGFQIDNAKSCSDKQPIQKDRKPAKYVARPLQTKMTDFWKQVKGSFRMTKKRKSVETKAVSKMSKTSKMPINMLE